MFPHKHENGLILVLRKERYMYHKSQHHCAIVDDHTADPCIVIMKRRSKANMNIKLIIISCNYTYEVNYANRCKQGNLYVSRSRLMDLKTSVCHIGVFIFFFLTSICRQIS